MVHQVDSRERGKRGRETGRGTAVVAGGPELAVLNTQRSHDYHMTEENREKLPHSLISEVVLEVEG